MIEVRKATAEDAPLILKFIIELAVYEKAEHEVKASVQDIEASLFGRESTAKALICTVDYQPAGYAVYFYNYSTWLGKNGIYLEDLYITPDHRKKGCGKFIFQHLAKQAVAEGCGRFEWSVLDWNQPAIDFYESFGAKPQPEWVGYRLSGDALHQFASS